jgi:hypothetical protein
VKAVLEVNSGTVAKLGIKPGDLVRHRIFEWILSAHFLNELETIVDGDYGEIYAGVLF